MGDFLSKSVMTSFCTLCVCVHFKVLTLLLLGFSFMFWNSCCMMLWVLSSKCFSLSPIWFWVTFGELSQGIGLLLSKRQLVTTRAVSTYHCSLLYWIYISPLFFFLPQNKVTCQQDQQVWSHAGHVPGVMQVHQHFPHLWLGWLAFFTAYTEANSCGSSLSIPYVFLCSLTKT